MKTIEQKFDQPLKDVIAYKIECIEVLTHIRNEQRKLFDRHGHLMYFELLNPLNFG